MILNWYLLKTMITVQPPAVTKKAPREREIRREVAGDKTAQVQVIQENEELAEAPADRGVVPEPDVSKVPDRPKT